MGSEAGAAVRPSSALQETALLVSHPPSQMKASPQPGRSPSPLPAAALQLARARWHATPALGMHRDHTAPFPLDQDTWTFWSSLSTPED